MYDIFMLSYGETQAEAHWRTLQRVAPHAQRVDGIAGIQAAHRHCATLARTSHFFVVDADNEVLPGFDVGFSLPLHDRAYVHLWQARNPVNGLVYGWGAIKLFPTRAALALPDDSLDMTTSLDLKLVPVIGSVTHFNTSPLTTWRSAFREAVKLTLLAPDNPEAAGRLAVWRAVAQGPYAGDCLRGAKAGARYAEHHRHDRAALRCINDYAWLTQRYQADLMAGAVHSC